MVLSPVSNPMVLSYYGPQVKNARLWDESIRPTIMSAAAERLDIASISEPEILQAIQTNHSVWVLSHSFDLSRSMIFDAACRLRTIGCGFAVKFLA